MKSGGLFNLYVQVSLPQGWHIYSLENRKNALRTSIKLNNIPFLTQGEWKESPPRITMDRVLQEMVKAHETIAGFTLGLKVPGSMVPGTFLISGILKYRLCDNRVCLQPKELPFQTNIRVVSMGEGAKVQ